VITPLQYDSLEALPTRYEMGFGVRGPDKKAYVIMARPLLPNETKTIVCRNMPKNIHIELNH
jgi:hypothetical protein